MMDTEGNESSTSKTYHSKRPHRKSRTGCRNCKARKVKCDEGRPACRTCTLRKESCIYLFSPSAFSLPRPSPERNTVLASRHRPPDLARYDNGDDKTGTSGSSTSSASLTPSPISAPSELAVIREPQFIFANRSALDMKILDFYTAKTFSSLSSWSTREPRVDQLLRVRMLELAMSQPFLMDGLLGLTVMHMNFLGQPDAPAAMAQMYRARAAAGYRRAIEAADPRTFPALLASSIILVGLATSLFRGDEARPLYVLDWITVWRGITLIIGLATPKTVVEAGMEMLFYRPPVDLDIAAEHVPNYLLFMVASIRPGDDDHASADVYYETLKYLGSLYRELKEEGPGAFLDLRIITFFTFVPPEFADLARRRRRRAAVIVAYYLAFMKLTTRIWWFSDITDREIGHIGDLVGPGPQWESLMRVPRSVTGLSDAAEIARLLLGNPSWEPPKDDEKQLVWVRGIVGDRGEFVYRRSLTLSPSPELSMECPG